MYHMSGLLVCTFEFSIAAYSQNGTSILNLSQISFNSNQMFGQVWFLYFFLSSFLFYFMIPYPRHPRLGTFGLFHKYQSIVVLHL